MNNRLLSVVLVVGIASTGFAGISAAQSGQLLNSSTQIEQSNTSSAKTHFGKRKGWEKLTEEEKTALASMTDAEKKAFFDAKKAKMDAERTAHKAVIDKLVAGETLTAAQEATRLEMVSKFAGEDNDHPHRRDGGDIIAKLVAGDALSDAEKTELTQMQTRHTKREAEKAKIDAMSETEKEAYFETKKAEMKAKMEIMKPLLDKQRNGETLTDAEKQILKDNKADMPFGGPGRGHGPRGGHGPDREMDDMPESTEKTAQ